MKEALLVAMTLVMGGCGYSTKPLKFEGAETVAVPIFGNSTRRRLHEFKLTEAVTNMIAARTRYRIAPEDKADLVVKGDIAQYETPGLVQGTTDQLVVSQVTILLKVDVIDRRTGVVKFHGQRTEVAPFSGYRGQNEDSADAEVYERLARWVVTTLEKGWD